MLTVHHLGVSRSGPVVWLCEELGLEYALIRHDRRGAAGAGAGDVTHPLGQTPIIQDGGLVLAECGAVIDYILTGHGKNRLRPRAEEAGFTDWLFWFHYASASLLAGELVALMPVGPGNEDNQALRWHRARCEAGLALAEARLADAAWFAGADFTAADIMMVFALNAMRTATGRDPSAGEATGSFLARVAERPAFRWAMRTDDAGTVLPAAAF